jgi:nucleoside-diphosphate-sugar epimerase
MFKWAVKLLVRHPSARFPSYSEVAGRSQRAVFDNSKSKRLLGWQPTSDPAAVIRLGIHVPADQAFT